ncbi:MAG: metal-sensing transcriptional repressor [Bacteroidia bacterium]
MYQDQLNEDIRKTYNGALGQLKGVEKMLDDKRCPFEVSSAIKAVSGTLKIITNEQLPHLQKSEIRQKIRYLSAHQSVTAQQRKELENTEDSLDEVKPEELPKLWHRLQAMERKQKS